MHPSRRNLSAIWDNLGKVSSIGWNENRQLFTLADEQWERAIFISPSENCSASSWHVTTPEDFHVTMLGGKVATGLGHRFVATCQQIHQIFLCLQETLLGLQSQEFPRKILLRCELK